MLIVSSAWAGWGCGEGRREKLQAFTVQKEGSALAMPSSTTANSHTTLTAQTMRASKVLAACKLVSIKVLHCTPLSQKNSLAAYVPLIHQLWPVLSYSVARLRSKAFSFSQRQKACHGWRKLGSCPLFQNKTRGCGDRRGTHTLKPLQTKIKVCTNALLGMRHGDV